MRLPRLGAPFLSFLLLINTALAVVLTNTEYNLQIGVPFTITWSENAAAVTIELYGGDTADSLFAVQTIATNVGGNAFTWTPADVPQRNAYAIVVSDGSTASAISFAFTFAAAQTTTSTTAPSTTSTTQQTQTTSPSILPGSTSTRIVTLTGTPPSNNTVPTTKPAPTLTPTGPPTSAATAINPAVPGFTRGDTSENLTLAAKIGVGLAAGVGMAAIIAGSVFMIMKKNKEYDRKKELEDGAGSGTGGSSPELGAAGWKTAEKRPEGMALQAGIELGRRPPSRSLTGPGAPIPSGAGGTPSGRLTPGRPSTPNVPRTPSPLAKEIGVAESGSPPRR
ncbi:hypothetical protein B0T16DRAFT_391261 [Cercophora newfieldiana]|uniref:Uncharacterized protein n=1 Tax=Cercophora newfieldiana TaxID=92897 RepID=A0AA39Y721_9PEZI|nr:hypothetical protein B0T16DRAFT_391261 [Cercophora newfieldiana]